MSFASQLSDLAKLDFAKIEVVENDISSNLTEALAFISDPDSYMRRKLSGTFVPSTMHFHVRAGDELFPADTEIPVQQIVISSTIYLSATIKKTVMDAIAKNKNSAPVNILYCEGCKECKIAVLR